MSIRARFGKVLRRWADRIDGGLPRVTIHHHAEHEPCDDTCTTYSDGPNE